MSAEEEVETIAARINARIAEEPHANGDYFTLTPAGREAVRQILDESHQPQPEGARP